MTNKIVLRDADQLMADYVSKYQPLYPLFMQGGVSYPMEVGKLNFKRMEAVGDIRSKHITPKDTHIHQLGAVEKSKSYKQYPLASQFVQSNFQDTRQNEDLVKQFLDEQEKQFDELFLLGDGTASNNVVNNGLFWSGDANWVENSSAEIDTDADQLIGLHAKVLEVAEDADLVSGRKIILFYGDTVMAAYNSVYAASSRAFKAVLREALEKNFSLGRIPAAITPAGAAGFIIANLDQVKMHHQGVPKLLAQGVNEEKMHTWHNFVMGSTMLEVLASGSVIKQPLTFEA
jgi:hypothetical protein